MSKEFFLLEDVSGHCSGIIYGKAGDKVNIVSNHGNVSIVEKNHERFPVNTEILSAAVVEGKETVKDDVKPALIKSKSKTKKPTQNHSSLF